MLTVLFSWVDSWDIDMNGDKFRLDDGCKCWVGSVIINRVTVRNLQRTVTRIIGWRFGKDKVVMGTEFWQTVQRHLWRMTRVICRLACISDRSVASSSVHSFYKNQHTASHFFAFHRKYIVRASPSPLSEIHPFNSIITKSHPFTFFLGKWFHPFNLFLFSAFILPFFGKNLRFLHPSPFFNPVSLRFCHYVK